MLQPVPTATKLLRIGELARQVGLSVDTLRHYERLGLLVAPRRTAGGFREFEPDAVRRVRTIQAALDLGFSLREIAVLLRQRAAGRPPCRKARALAVRKLDELDRQLAQLGALRGALAEIIRDWDAQLARTRDGTPAYLLDSLPERLEHQLARRAAVPAPVRDVHGKNRKKGT